MLESDHWTGHFVAARVKVAAMNGIPQQNAAAPVVPARQSIGRLTPLADVAAALAVVSPVAARIVPVEQAAGLVLAETVTGRLRPEAACALVDGYAVRAEDTRDAGGYAPALLTQPPEWVEAGAPLPPGADAVAPPATVAMSDIGAEVLSPLAPGDGVRAVGADCVAGATLIEAGRHVRQGDIASLTLVGVNETSVRAPRILIALLRDDDMIRTIADVIADRVAAMGGRPSVIVAAMVDAALAGDADAILSIGKTGEGRDDDAVLALMRAGKVIAHGIAVSPGETAAAGFVGACPVLMLPGRLDAALAVWLTLGRSLLARLTGRVESLAELSRPRTLPLTQKIVSTIGLCDVVPVAVTAEGAVPLATRFWPLPALTRAEGFVLVPAESEGFPPGAMVTVTVADWR